MRDEVLKEAAVVGIPKSRQSHNRKTVSNGKTVTNTFKNHSTHSICGTTQRVCMSRATSGRQKPISTPKLSASDFRACIACV